MFALIVLGFAMLLLGLAALVFEQKRQTGNPLSQVLADITTKLIHRPARSNSTPATPAGTSVLPRSRPIRLRRFVHKLRWGPRIVPLLFICAFLAAGVAGGLWLVGSRGTHAAESSSGVVIGIAAFADAPPVGSPVDAFADHLLTAAAADHISGLVVRESRNVVTTPEGAEAERARVGADLLLWGQVGADGSLTASIALSPNFAAGQPEWNRFRPHDLTQLVFPTHATLLLSPTQGTDPLLPLALAVAHLKLGDYAEAARAGYGAQATLQESNAGASGRQMAVVLEAAGDYALGNYNDALHDFDAVQDTGELPLEGSVVRAAVRLATGDDSGARADAEQVIDGRDASNLTLSRAYLARGRASLALNDLPAALSDLESSARLDPDYGPTTLDRAEVLYRQSQPDGARTALQAVLTHAPHAAPAYRLLGLTMLMLDKSQDAQTALGQAESLYNGWIGGLRAQEASAQATGDADRGRAATGAIVDLNKELAGIYLYEGMAWAGLAGKEPDESFLGGLWRRIRGQPTTFERALSRMQDAQRLDPLRPDVPLQMASVYSQLGDTAAASQSLAAAQKLDPSAPEPYLALAQLQTGENKPQDAVATLQSLLAQNPAYYPAYNQIYSIYSAAGNTQAAQATLQQALNIAATGASDHLWHARFLHTLGADGQAINEAKAAALDPQLWEAHLLLAQLLQSAGQAPDALNEYNQALTIQPNNPEALLGAAQLLSQAGRRDDAQNLFERLTTIWPSNVDGHIAYVQLLIGKGDTAKAVAQGRLAVSQDGSRADSHFALGLAYEAAQDWANAAAEFQATTQRDPQQFDAFIKWAHALYLGDKYKDAIAVCQSAITLRAGDPQPYRWKAAAELALNDTADAVQSVAEAVQPAPSNADVLALASRIYTQAGDWQHAADYANRAMQANAQDPSGPLATGEYDLASGQPAQALQAYAAALAISPNSAEALTGEGRASAELNDQAKALQEYQAALGADPKYAPAHLYAGHSLVALNRWNDAFDQYRAAVQLRPDWPQALSSLGKAYLQRQDLQNAQAAFTKATQEAPNMVDAWFGLGMSSRDKGQAADAIKELGQAVNLDGNYSQAWLYLGLTYEEAGQRSLAAGAFTHAINTAQDASIKEQAQEGLSRVK